MVHLAKGTRGNSECVVEGRQEEPSLLVQHLEASFLTKGRAAIGEEECCSVASGE